MSYSRAKVLIWNIYLYFTQVLHSSLLTLICLLYLELCHQLSIIVNYLV